jgi:hypothetical protein
MKKELREVKYRDFEQFCMDNWFTQERIGFVRIVRKPHRITGKSRSFLFNFDAYKEVNGFEFKS